MNKNPLQVVSTENNTPPLKDSCKSNRRAEIEARFDRIWLQTPQKLDPQSTALGRERIERTVKFLRQHYDPDGCLVVDLGCGNGCLSRILRDLGAHVDAVDISANALKELKKRDFLHIEPIQDYLPKSLLADDKYDIVVAADLIAYLDPKEYRLFFSELARIIKAEGMLICSTPIDVYSEGALQKFVDYAQTEFAIEKLFFSHHYLLIRLLDFFKAPSRFARGAADKNYRNRKLSERVSLNHWWYKVNSSFIPGYAWRGLQYLTNPIARFLENSPRVIQLLEKLSKWVWNDAAISHVIMAGKRKSILPQAIESMQPQEQKHKKQLWE